MLFGGLRPTATVMFRASELGKCPVCDKYYSVMRDFVLLCIRVDGDCGPDSRAVLYSTSERCAYGCRRCVHFTIESEWEEFFTVLFPAEQD